MKAIIFGSGGQDGYYLSDLLKQENCDVTGVSRSDADLKGDVADFSFVEELIRDRRPNFIFHLAARSSTRHQAIFDNHAAIATGTLNILESVRRHSPATRVFIAGSGLQFVNQGKPIRETDPFEARDPYSVSRIQSVYAARYFLSIGIPVYVGYFFNHDSPRRTEGHMTKKISEAARRIAAGSGETLEIGDVEVIKEYGFAGDIMKGVWTLVNQDRVFEACIATGEGHSIREWLEQCFSLVNRDWRDHVAVKKNYVPEYRTLVSDPALIFSLGWKPEVSFAELAAMMMRS